MSSKPIPVIWLRDTGQRIPCFDNCQLTITRMSNIKDLPSVMVLLYYIFQGTGSALARAVQVSYGRKYGQSRDKQIFLGRWVNFQRYGGSARGRAGAPLFRLLEYFKDR